MCAQGNLTMKEKTTVIINNSNKKYLTKALNMVINKSDTNQIVW